MFDPFVRRFEFLTRLAKAAAFCALGAGAIIRCYDRLDGMAGLYALVMCIFFAISMAGIAIHMLCEESREDRQVQ